jgi:hypothetical protein
VAAIAPILEVDEESLDALLRRDPTALLRRLRTRHASGRLGTLVFVDQLEELLTQSEPAEASLFAEAIGALIVPSAGVRVLATIRGDFITRLASVRPLGDEVPRALLVLRPLSAEQIRQTIVGPAGNSGFAFESDEMVASLVESTSSMPGGLPLLQFALEELWNSLDRERNIIPVSALERIGGVRGALARHADGVLSRMPPEQQSASRRVLLRLVTEKGTGGRGTASALGARDGASLSAPDDFVSGRCSLSGGWMTVLYEFRMRRSSVARMREWLRGGWGSPPDRARRRAAAAERERLGRRPETRSDRSTCRSGARRERELTADQTPSSKPPRRRFSSPPAHLCYGDNRSATRSSRWLAGSRRRLDARPPSGMPPGSAPSRRRSHSMLRSSSADDALLGVRRRHQCGRWHRADRRADVGPGDPPKGRV